MTEPSEDRFLQWKRLQFNCRRGHAEVEYLLSSYCHHLNPQNPSPQNPHHSDQMDDLEALLSESDQTLFEWLLQSDTAESPGLVKIPDAFKPLIQAIRCFNRSMTI